MTKILLSIFAVALLTCGKQCKDDKPGKDTEVETPTTPVNPASAE